MTSPLWWHRGDVEVTAILPVTERSEQPLQGSPCSSQLPHSEADAPALPLSQQNAEQKEKKHCPPLRETLAKPDRELSAVPELSVTAKW